MLCRAVCFKCSGTVQKDSQSRINKCRCASIDHYRSCRNRVSPTGAVIIGILIGGTWLTIVFCVWAGKRKAENDSRKIEENPQKYLQDNLGRNLGGDLYRGATSLDAHIERATRPKSEFRGMTACPVCGTFAYHHIINVVKGKIKRQCVNHDCEKTWKETK